ncbi:MAG TPA: maleylpyruvate isomerase N-terminal domain-containing protein, partial [Acidimicrobiales bacterium]|nr:maleylpyruvate isomerase N-terminal domain-containing protein [Acidimicrobiales bacterium]
RRPSAPALGTWDLTDVAAHLSHSLDAIAAMTEGGGGLLEDIWTLSSLTERLVDGESERDLCALADRIQATADRLVSLMETGDPSVLITWIVQGVELPLPLLTCHALNELLVHGRDIAMAEGVTWAIPRPQAVQVVCGFLFPVLGRLGGVMVDQQAAAGVRATYDVRVRGGCRVTVRIHDGDMTLTQGGPGGPADCHLWVDPAAFLLVAWGRVGQWRAIARGQLLAWGRRPWLGLRFRTMLENP